jgi:uncharacterized protein (TIGR02271 family)
MVLHKLEEFDPQYRETLDNQDIKGLEVYRDGTDEKIGIVKDALVDDEGRFRYLVVDLGFWIFGKKVLLPIGRTRIEYPRNRVYAIDLTRKQAEDLPDVNEQQPLDGNQEEQVRSVYRNTGVSPTTANKSANAQAAGVATTSRPITTSYEQEPDLFELNDQNHHTLKLYQERLIANKRREKIGEVTVGKRVEVDTTRVAVPIEKERVVIEHRTPSDAGRIVSPEEGNFRAGEVARVELYEETPEIRKEAFVREEVRVKKVVDHETIESQETVRREQLNVDAKNLPVEER